MDFEIKACLARRRQGLSELDRTVVLAAGWPQPRNFRANTYPFRASSHFLYYAGLSLPGAFLVHEGGQTTIYRPRETADDILWHGPQASCEALSARTDCAVKYLDTLDRQALRGAACLPLSTAEGNLRLSELLGRTIEYGVLEASDERLARVVVSQRMINDDWAIRELTAAADVTMAAHRAARAVIAPGKSSFQIWAEMQRVMTDAGMCPAYGPIITPNGHVLHDDVLTHPLYDGDLLLLDVGAETQNGWAADVTRTWPVSGEYSPTQSELIQAVVKSQAAAIERVRPGVRYRDVHLAACRSLTESLVELGILLGDADELVADDVHSAFFPHGVGHLLGLDVHDMEDLGDRPGYPVGRPRSDRFGLCYLRLDRELEPGMLVTIEPGFYQVDAILTDPTWRQRLNGRVDWSVLSKFADVSGIRIEDDVLVTAQGARTLTEELPRR